jgi:hypothetical protein
VKDYDGAGIYSRKTEAAPEGAAARRISGVSRVNSSRTRWSRYKYRILLASLLVLVVARPVMVNGFVSSLVVDGTYAGLVLLSLVLTRRTANTIAATIMLTGALVSGYLVAITWETGTRHSLVLAIVSYVFSFGFLCLLCATILRDVLTRPIVTEDGLCGALSVYLLIGTVWANVYTLLYIVDPRSFASAGDLPVVINVPFDLETCSAAFVYYSFVTLSTLGLGDIHPTSRLARSLSWMEAVAGQLYLAVLVARLVSLQVARSDRDDETVAQ